MFEKPLTVGTNAPVTPARLQIALEREPTAESEDARSLRARAALEVRRRRDAEERAERPNCVKSVG